jgi:large subunit ribosomal protein L9
MQVLLLQRVEKLGNFGDVVTVKNGYARNFLLPFRKAERATKENIAAFAARKVQLLADSDAKKAAAQQQAATMEGLEVVIIRQAGESGQLYGSVSSRDIADAVSAKGFPAARQHVVMDVPVKELGVYRFRLNLHPEVATTVLVNVAMSEDEAKAQSVANAKANAMAATASEEDTDEQN